MSEKIVRNVDAILEIEIQDGVDWRWYREEGRDPEPRGGLYGNVTDEEIFAHWAHNAVANGVEDACRLDGWADLERGAIRFTVRDVEVG